MGLSFISRVIGNCHCIKYTSFEVVEDNIKTDLYEMVCGDVDWIHVTYNRIHWQAVVNTVMKIQISQKAGNFLTS